MRHLTWYMIPWTQAANSLLEWHGGLWQSRVLVAPLSYWKAWLVGQLRRDPLWPGEQMLVRCIHANDTGLMGSVRGWSHHPPLLRPFFIHYLNTLVCPASVSPLIFPSALKYPQVILIPLFSYCSISLFSCKTKFLEGVVCTHHLYVFTFCFVQVPLE